MKILRLLLVFLDKKIATVEASIFARI